MSTGKYLLISSLDATVPKSFVKQEMSDTFQTMVDSCPQITRHLSWDDLKLTPAGTELLRPVAYNLLVDALADASLLSSLKHNSVNFGYWFFNLFIIPDPIKDTIPDGNLPITGVFKGITGSITVLPINHLAL